MVQLSMNETTTFRWSFEEDAANYAAADIPAMGVWRQKLSDCGLARAIELLQQTGMKVSHLFWAGGFTGGDGRTYRESVEDAVEAVRTTAALGAGCLAICSGARAGHTSNHARRLLQGALIELAPLAEELGVVLALEPMHPGCSADWTFLTNLDETVAILEAIGRPEVKMVLDAYHLGQDPALVERIPQIVSHVALVQLGDAKCPPQGEQNRCLLGSGTVPLKEIVCALKSAGYDGFYDVELLGEELGVADYHGLLLHAKQAFDKWVMGS
jgi:sugar phosphate isomerase/epimerase